MGGDSAGKLNQHQQFLNRDDDFYPARTADMYGAM